MLDSRGSSDSQVEMRRSEARYLAFGNVEIVNDYVATLDEGISNELCSLVSYWILAYVKMSQLEDLQNLLQHLEALARDIVLTYI